MGKCMFMRKGKTHTDPIPLPSGYTKLAYIQSSGTQYINTLFKPNQDTRVLVDFWSDANASKDLALFGARKGSSDTAYVVWLSRGMVNSQYGSVSFNTKSLTLDYAKRLTYDMNKNVFSVGSQTATYTYASLYPNYNLFLLSVNSAGSADSRRAIGKLYSCQIYDNGTLVRDFVPCINASGAVGLYDLVGKQFYANAGSGTFTGSEVS